MEYHCFISYTNREDELRELRPLLDELGRAFQALRIVHAPFFWDRFELSDSFDTSELAAALLRAIDGSACMIAFVSPRYVSSPWCVFEWGAMNGVARRRGPQWPVVRPYVWRPRSHERSWLEKMLDRTVSAAGDAHLDKFVAQVPYRTLDVDVGALRKYEPLPWKVRNPIGDHLYALERRKLTEFLADVVEFVAATCDEMSQRGLAPPSPNARVLRTIAKKLADGWSLEDVARLL